MRIPYIFAAVALTIFNPEISLAHRARLDGNGGHWEKQTHTYHCHKSPCAAAHQQQRSALKEAIDENRPFSRIYNRSDWPHWLDSDGDCQDTRTEILVALSTATVRYKDRKKCWVKSGRWQDPYTGKIWKDASRLDLDHVVPLEWAHRHGGSTWSSMKKSQFANDQANLLATEDRINKQKGAQGPDEWLPPLGRYQCIYIANFKHIALRYGLQLTAREAAFFDANRRRCKN